MVCWIIVSHQEPLDMIPQNNGIVNITPSGSHKEIFDVTSTKVKVIDALALIVRNDEKNVFNTWTFWLMELNAPLQRALHNQDPGITHQAVWNEQSMYGRGLRDRTPKPCPKTVREIFAHSRSFYLQRSLLQFAAADNNRQVMQYLDYDAIGKDNIIVTHLDPGSTRFTMDFTTYIHTGQPIVAPQITVNQLMCNTNNWC